MDPWLPLGRPANTLVRLWLCAGWSETLPGKHGQRSISWTAPCEIVSSGICRQRGPRSACASAQSDQGLRCPQTDSSDIIECLSAEQMPGCDFAPVQNDVNPHILRRFEGTFFAWHCPYTICSVLQWALISSLMCHLSIALCQPNMTSAI